MKKLTALIVTVFLAAGAAAFAGCAQKPQYAEAYITVSINPEVELAIDGDGNISGVYTVNEDAEILLSETSLEGENAEDGIEKIVNLAAEAGYIDVEGEDNEVKINVITDDGDAEIGERIKGRIKRRIERFFDNNGINGIVSEETLEAFAERAAELRVSLGKTKIILRALELDPTLDIDELKDMPMKELLALAKERLKQKVDPALRAEIKADIEELMDKYPEIPVLREEMKGLREQLENFEGSGEERQALEAQLKEKEDELKVLMDSLKEEIRNIKEEYKGRFEQKREERKTELRGKLARFKDRLKAAREKRGKGN